LQRQAVQTSKLEYMASLIYLYEENDKRQKGVYEDRIEGFRKKEEKPRMREMRLD
jgi:hypothetical protein